MDKGYKYVGMQYGGECWGGNTVGRYGKRPDSECNMRCKHDKNRYCGSSWRNNVFKLKIVAREYKSIVGESYIGCYKDTGRRDLPTMLGG
jgi:hypothetical protein